MPAVLNLKKAELLKEQLTTAQNNQIRVMYKRLADQVGRESFALRMNDDTSSILKKQYLQKLENKLRTEVRNISNQLNNIIPDTSMKVADAVVLANKEWLSGLGMNMTGAWLNVPTDVVNSIMTGKVYDSGWSLSKRIWGIEQKTMQDIHYVIAQGMAANKSSFEIAKDLEKYVNPSAAKTWDWKKVYPNTNKTVDYNAQRLARTLTHHAYQQSFVATTKFNPFVEKYKWLSSNGANTCQICAERNGQLFDKDKLPLDHPNGKCTWSAVISKSSKEINQEIANWYKSDDGTYPEMDDFAKSLGYKPSDDVIKKVEGNIKPTITKQSVAPTVRKIKNASKFLNEFEFEKHAENNYIETLQSTDVGFQNAFVKAMNKKVKIWDYPDEGEGSYFSEYREKIALTPDALNCWSIDGFDNHRRQTLFHEVGHAIDSLSPGTNSRFSKSTKYGFNKAMMEDMKAMNERCKNDKDFVNELKTMMQDDRSRGVQDAMSAMHCKGINLEDVKNNVRVRWGHTQEYYERDNAKNEAASELFANMCGAKTDVKAQEYMQQYFPNALNVFEKIMKSFE